MTSPRSAAPSRQAPNRHSSYLCAAASTPSTTLSLLADLRPFIRPRGSNRSRLLIHAYHPIHLIKPDLTFFTCSSKTMAQTSRSVDDRNPVWTLRAQRKSDGGGISYSS